MPENDEKPAKTLANLPLGQITGYLGPLALVVWQGMVWASEIEANVKSNQAQIEQLIEQVRRNDESDETRQTEIIEAIEQLGERVVDEADSAGPEPGD